MWLFSATMAASTPPCVHLITGYISTLVLAQAVRSADIIEWLPLNDIVDHNLEILRLRKASAAAA
jgi:hypothetical protein